MVVHVGAGLLALLGLRAVLVRWLDGLPDGVVHGTLLALGLALLAFGLGYRATPAAQEPARTPRTLSPLSTFALGAAVMLNELTTALPYVVAIERIADAGLGLVGALLSLGLYNLAFALPLLAFLGLLIRYRQRFTNQLERISATLRRCTPKAVKAGSIAVGTGLAAWGGLALLG